ncbi:MAG: GNAT family N-acetyltransferase [Hyphomicrobiales bacterium]
MTGLDEETEDPLQKRAGAVPAELFTARLRLRGPGEADAPAIAALANNPKVARMTRSMPWPYGEADARAWIGRMSGPASRTRAFLLALLADGTVIGAAGLGADEQGETEIGYWLGETHWGKGYATEAAQRVTDHAFQDLGQDRLHAHCLAGNARSRRVLQKCGFQYTGAGMTRIVSRRGPVPSEDFVLERNVWVALKNWTGK